MTTHNQCIFCNLSSERIIAENDKCFAIRDGFPVSEGHTLIIPKRHVADYFDLTADETDAMLRTPKEESEASFLTSRNIKRLNLIQQI